MDREGQVGSLSEDRRKEMEMALARQFGFPDYESFRQGIIRTLGKAGLKRLEKQLDHYGPSEQAAPDE